MKFSDDGQLLFVFWRGEAGDSWLKEVRELFMGPLGWDPEDWDSSFGQPDLVYDLFVHYRISGLTPLEAVKTFVKHPDFIDLEEDFLNNLEEES